MELPLHPRFLEQSKRRRYLLGISGGRDSVALLHSLLDHGYRRLVLCHLNHGLRGKESGKDDAFVRRLAKKLGLTCEVDKVNINTLMNQHGESMELASRRARHQFFTRCAKSHRCDRVLLAHHADDQVETILFNLMRGSAGLKGMSMSSRHQIHGKSMEFSRPLLDVTRDQINTYLSDRKIRYREDASNAEPFATRNRLRNEALPLLNDIMGRDIRAAVLRAEKITNNQEQCVREMLDACQLEDPQGRLFLPKILALSPAAQTTALQIYLKKNHIHDLGHDVLERCRELINNHTTSKTNLPGNRFFRRKAKRLFID